MGLLQYYLGTGDSVALAGSSAAASSALGALESSTPVALAAAGGGVSFAQGRLSLRHALRGTAVATSMASLQSPSQFTLSGVALATASAVGELQVRAFGQDLFDPTSDFLRITDCLEQVSFQRMGELATQPVPHALRRGVRHGEVEPSNGHYQFGDVRWHLDRQEVATPPRPGDRVIDVEGRAWTCLDVEEDVHRSRWECHCRDLVVTEGLRSRVTVQVARWGKDAAGAAVPRWEDFRLNVAARVQPLAATTAMEHHRRGEQATAVMILGDPIPFDDVSNYRIVTSEGTVYKILELEQTQRLDVLPQVRVTRTPWPLE